MLWNSKALGHYDTSNDSEHALHRAAVQHDDICGLGLSQLSHGHPSSGIDPACSSVGNCSSVKAEDTFFWLLVYNMASASRMSKDVVWVLHDERRSNAYF